MNRYRKFYQKSGEPAQRKRIAKYLVSLGRHSVRSTCKLVGLSRNTYRYKPRRTNKDSELEAALLEKAKQYPHYGAVEKVSHR